MKITNSDSVVIIQQESESIPTLIFNIDSNYDNYNSTHIIVQLNEAFTFSADDFQNFMSLALKQKNNKQSFVIVLENIALDAVPESLNIVPTLQEAYDIIEMEDIERDLGF